MTLNKLKEKIDKYFRESTSLFIENNKLEKLKLQVLKPILVNSSIKLDYFEIIESESFIDAILLISNLNEE